MKPMKLNKKQKQYLFTQVFAKADLNKIFDTTNIEWLVNQKITLKDGLNGWKAVFMDNDEYTQINCVANPGWLDDLEHIENLEQCQWCDEWFTRDEMVFHKRGFTKLCLQCQNYLISREGKI